MNTWIPKNKIVKVVAGILLASVVLYFGGLFIALKQINKVESLYNNTESESSKNDKLSAIKTLAEANQDGIATLRNFFIKKDDEVKFIEQIEMAAKNSSIKSEITSIDVKTEEIQSPFKEDVEVKMNIEGPWGNVMTFMDKLERLPFGVEVENMNFDASSPKYWSGGIEFIVFREK
jgi:hypothetical protein